MVTLRKDIFTLRSVFCSGEKKTCESGCPSYGLHVSRRSNRRQNSQMQKPRHLASGNSIVRRIVVMLAIGVFLTAGCTYFLLHSYLRGDKFRVLINQLVGDVIGANVEFNSLEWKGVKVRTDGFRAEGSGSLRSAYATDLTANMRLLHLFSGEWFIENLQIAELYAHLDVSKDQVGSGTATRSKSDQPLHSENSGEKGFLWAMLPDRSSLQSLEVSKLRLKVRTRSGAVELTDGLLSATEGRSQKHSHDFMLSDALIHTPWFADPIHLDSAKGRYVDERLSLHQSSSRIFGNGQLSLSGQLDKGGYEWFGILEGVDVEELIAEDWKKRLSGILRTEFNLQSKQNGFKTRGRLMLNNGVLTALPVLDRIAAYTNTNRFRRLRLTQCQLNYKSEHAVHTNDEHVRIELSDIVLVSEGLVRMMGDLVIDDGKLDGEFRVGIMPGLLAHIPGAETKVFDHGERGLRWAPLRITGTIDSPKEDLSERILAAAGERIIELVPETGEKVLKLAQDKAVELPEAVINISGEALEQGDEVIKEGVDVLREGVDSALDLIPGLNSSRQR